MKDEILQRVEADFPASDRSDALAELQRLSLQDVMANSQVNLDNTLMAALQLSEGDLSRLRSLIDAAKIDFRDVIYWATRKANET